MIQRAIDHHEDSPVTTGCSGVATVRRVVEVVVVVVVVVVVGCCLLQ